MYRKAGFTLIELLVVIGIIGILIAALVPQAQKAQIRAKEAAIKAQCSNIEASLAAYAQSHNGHYPGVAVDVMAPYSDHALGDNLLYTKAPANAFDAAAGRMVQGVLGGFGHYNGVATGMFEQLRDVKNLPINANTGAARYFDNLMASDSVQEYPANPFLTSNIGGRARMRNIFTFQFNISGGFNPNNAFSPGVSDPGAANYDCALYVTPGGTGGAVTVDTQDTLRVFLRQNPLPGGLPVVNFVSTAFSQECRFGTDEGDYFAPGDFAYVPVLSTSPYGFGDSTATLENELYKWGTGVTGYMLFGYGHQSHKGKEYEDQQREFAATGLAGYGAPGVDTIYENYVLQLFEGAIYFNSNV